MSEYNITWKDFKAGFWKQCFECRFCKENYFYSNHCKSTGIKHCRAWKKYVSKVITRKGKS